MPFGSLSQVNELVTDAPRAVVAVNEDASSHRRSLEVVSALRRLDLAVTLVSPGRRPEGFIAQVRHCEIGAGALPRLLGRYFGTISRNLARLAITILTLLPVGAAQWALDRSTRSILRLEGLMQELRDSPDIVLVEDVLLLPAVIGGKGDARVIFDAREFFPLQFEHSFIWRILIGSGMHRLMRLLLPKCDAITTVSEGLSAGYRELYGVEPHVILNVPECGSGRSARSHGGPAGGSPLRIVFHGRANRNRKIGVFISAGGLLTSQATVDLYLTGPRRRRRAITRSAAGVANVHVHEPVRFDEVPTVLAGFDLGAILYPASTFNLLHSMPSKFFDYLVAGLPVVIGPYPDMARLVRAYDCGIIAEDFTSQALADAIDGISPERLIELRANARSAADDLCAEIEYRKLESLVRGLLARGESGS